MLHKIDFHSMRAVKLLLDNRKNPSIHSFLFDIPTDNSHFLIAVDDAEAGCICRYFATVSGTGSREGENKQQMNVAESKKLFGVMSDEALRTII